MRADLSDKATFEQNRQEEWRTSTNKGAQDRLCQMPVHKFRSDAFYFMCLCRDLNEVGGGKACDYMRKDVLSRGNSLCKGWDESALMK